MAERSYFVDIILPLSLDDIFTYQCTADEFSRLQKGMRVAVQFGKTGVQTGLVYAKHRNQPVHFKTKPILEVVDEEPVVNKAWWNLIEFISQYYITPLGLSVRMALPSSFLLKSERYLALLPGVKPDLSALDDDMYLIWEALEKEGVLSVEELQQIIGKKNKALRVFHRLIDEGLVQVYTEIKERYKPKLVKYLDIALPEEEWNSALDSLQRAPKQKELFLHFLNLYFPVRKPVLKSELTKHFSPAIIKALVEKRFLKELEVAADRQVFEKEEEVSHRLSAEQEAALKKILRGFEGGKTVLLHGVTASGKTEIYSRLIEEVIRQGGQVLYLVPEISLTTHLVARLKSRFGPQMGVFHSKYSFDQRHEVWMHALHGDEKAGLVVGTRSAMFVPFKNLQLIIVDEEHDDSFKENFHQPHYQARDMSTVMARIHQARLILGTATPSVESYHNALTGKYHLVELKSKFHANKKVEKQIIDLKEVYKQNRRKGHFSFEVLDAIRNEIKHNGQVLVFVNRRGYAPVAECRTCGHVETCPHCSVSLTYHKFDNKLKCHYCGYSEVYTGICRACGSTDIDLHGTGTEQILAELKEIFPDFSIGRMDADTTRNKRAFENLIHDFDSGKYQILVGTQMITKGLDFSNVGLVVVPSADQLIYFPDFRSHERAFQMLMQVAGRTGRRNRQGKVMIQSFAPGHPVIQYFLKEDFEGFMQNELKERQLFGYPPYMRLVKFEFRAKNPQVLRESAFWFYKALTYYFNKVLGPSEPPVFKIRNRYRLEVMLKFPAKENYKKHHEIIRKLVKKFKTIRPFKSVQIDVNPDP